jgi:hypothetical protein
MLGQEHGKAGPEAEGSRRQCPEGWTSRSGQSWAHQDQEAGQQGQDSRWRRRDAADDHRAPGGAMHGQPERKGDLAPERQMRGHEEVIAPGRFEEETQISRKAAQERDKDRVQHIGAGKGEEDPKEGQPSGGGKGKEGKDPWAQYLADGAQPAGKAGGGQAADADRAQLKMEANLAACRSDQLSRDGLPAGSMEIPGVKGYWRNPENDFLYQVGYLPPGEKWRQEGKRYLTEHSPHAREVVAKQLPGRKAFLEAFGYPDGHDGLTFRQVCEVLATEWRAVGRHVDEPVRGLRLLDVHKRKAPPAARG